MKHQCKGTETEQGVISALDKIALNAHLFDLVVIIRGGGSQTDLSWFDSYNIAYHVTQFPLPVITGIGHDKDISVTDMVANRSLKTPTAVADFLIDCVSATDNRIISMTSDIIDLSRIIIEKNRNTIETAGIKLLPLTRIMLSGIKDNLSGKIIDIINFGKEFTFKAVLIPANHESRLYSAVKSFSSGKETVLRRNSQSLITSTVNLLNKNNLILSGLASTLNLLNPENVLQRGYSITSINGLILKNSDKVEQNDLIDTQLYKGSLSSRVEKGNGEKESERIY